MSLRFAPSAHRNYTVEHDANVFSTSSSDESLSAANQRPNDSQEFSFYTPDSSDLGLRREGYLRIRKESVKSKLLAVSLQSSKKDKSSGRSRRSLGYVDSRHVRKLLKASKKVEDDDDISILLPPAPPAKLPFQKYRTAADSCTNLATSSKKAEVHPLGGNNADGSGSDGQEPAPPVHEGPTSEPLQFDTPLTLWSILKGLTTDHVPSMEAVKLAAGSSLRGFSKLVARVSKGLCRLTKRFLERCKGRTPPSARARLEAPATRQASNTTTTTTFTPPLEITVCTQIAFGNVADIKTSCSVKQLPTSP